MSALNPAIFDTVITRLSTACLPEPGSTFQDAAHLPEMVVIPGGSFIMGSPEAEPGRENNEGPQHRVEICRFALGKYPVTQRQWHALMGDNPSYFSNRDDIEANADRPVERVSWGSAKRYIEQLNKQSGNFYQLPTEAQWEYACRAGSTAAYPWGDTIKPGDATFNCPVEALGTASVYGGHPNAFGLHDMIGNVWEMVEDDDSDDYHNAPTDGSAWKDPRFTYGSDDKVKRGGSWDLPAEYLRCACRSWAGAYGEGDELTGFRVAMPLPPEDWNSVKRVVRGEVDPDGERLTLLYGDMSAADWDGGLPVARIAPPKDGTLTVQFLIDADTPNLAELLHGAYRHIKEVLLRFNILPPWDYAKHRCGSFSNVYGEWHWGYMPAESQAPMEPSTEPEAQADAIIEPPEQQDDSLSSIDPRKRWYHFVPITNEQPPTNTYIKSPDERRSAFKEYLSKLNLALSEIGEAQRRICPCCGYPTLQLEFVYEEQCEICFWEDVGKSAEYNDHAIHGQRAYSLAEARKHFDLQPYSSFCEHRQLRPGYDWLILGSDRNATWRAVLEHSAKVHARLNEIARAEQQSAEQEANTVGLTLPDATQATHLCNAQSNSNRSADSDTASGDWQRTDDDGAGRYRLRAEIMALREEVNRSETMFRVSAIWWRRKRWMFVLMAVGMLFFMDRLQCPLIAGLALLLCRAAVHAAECVQPDADRIIKALKLDLFEHDTEV